MKKLKINYENLTGIFISHLHGDHTGGLMELVRLNPGIKVALPAHGSERLAGQIRGMGGSVVLVEKPVELWRGMFSTGEIQGPPFEQGLILVGEGRTALIVGCSHPGVDVMVRRARRVVGGAPDLVLGGFHLFAASQERIIRIIEAMRKEGVKRVAPCHCTGKRAISLFKREFGDSFLACGAGLTVVLP